MTQPSQVEETKVDEAEDTSAVTETPAPVDEIVVDGRDYRVEGNDISGYVGVDPEYMTYANETEKPLNTAQEQWDLGLLDHLEGNMDKAEECDETAEAEADETEAEESEAPVEETEAPPAPATLPSHNPPNIPGVMTPIVQS